MGFIPFAFSVHHFISSVGADAGFAAIIGLAILVLLYFAQARETSSLREQAAEAAQRVAQLEAQMSRVGRPQPTSVVPPPAGAGRVVASAPGRAVAAAASVPSASPAPARRLTPADAQAPSPAPAPALVGAPAGVGAPALSAATRLIPASASGAPASGAPATAASASGAPAAPVSEAAVAPSPGGAPPAVPATGEPAPDGSGAGANEQTPAPSGPPPATAAGGAANGSSRNRAVPAAPVAAAAAGAAAAGAQGPPAVQFRPPAAGVSAPAPAAGRRPPNDGRRSGAGRALLLALGLIGVALVVAVLLVATSGGTHATSSSSGAAQTSNAPSTRTRSSSRTRTQPAVVAPGSVTVAVLNGTATSNLAHRVALKLTAAGYKQGTIATAPDQTHTSTVVAYLPGDRRQAIAVATSLKLGSASVQPVDQSNQAVACLPGTSCAANVVVIVGSDLAATA